MAEKLHLCGYSTNNMHQWGRDHRPCEHKIWRHEFKRHRCSTSKQQARDQVGSIKAGKSRRRTSHKTIPSLHSGWIPAAGAVRGVTHLLPLSEIDRNRRLATGFRTDPSVGWAGASELGVFLFQTILAKACLAWFRRMWQRDYSLWGKAQ